MRPKLPRFRVRTLLLTIALVAALLGVWVWYFTPKIGLRLILDRASWMALEDPRGVVEITNQAPRGRRIDLLKTSVIGLNLIVTDASGKIITGDRYWFLDSLPPNGPWSRILGPGTTYSMPIYAFRMAEQVHPAPGTYTVEAVYDQGRVHARSNKVMIQYLLRPVRHVDRLPAGASTPGGPR